MIFGAALGFLGKNWKIAALGGGVIALWFAYNHYQGLKESKRILEENQVKLESAVETERASFQTALKALDEWEKSRKRLQAKIEEFNAFSEEANEEVRRLDEMFAKHDLEALALAKPGLVERRINAGTARIFRMLEAATTDTTRRGISGG